MDNTLDQRRQIEQQAVESLTIAISFNDGANCYTPGLGSNLNPTTLEVMNIPSTPKVRPDDLHFFRVK